VEIDLHSLFVSFLTLLPPDLPLLLLSFLFVLDDRGTAQEDKSIRDRPEWTVSCSFVKKVVSLVPELFARDHPVQQAGSRLRKPKRRNKANRSFKPKKKD
jgi:hypothetical protein